MLSAILLLNSPAHGRLQTATRGRVQLRDHHYRTFSTLQECVFHSRRPLSQPNTTTDCAHVVSLTVIDRNGIETIVANPTDFPDIINHTKIAAVEEPMVICTILVPEDYIGPMMELCTNRRGEQLQYSYLEQGEVAVEDGAGELDGGLKSEGVSSNRALLKYKIPMAEIVTSFFDELKRRVVHFFMISSR